MDQHSSVYHGSGRYGLANHFKASGGHFDKQQIKNDMWIKPVKSIPQVTVMVDCLGKFKFKESLLKISKWK